jgi:hypothetical protein
MKVSSCPLAFFYCFHYNRSPFACKDFFEISHKKNKRPPGTGSLLLSYVAIASVETIMLANILARF